jgi:hypothetical protein
MLIGRFKFPADTRERGELIGLPISLLRYGAKLKRKV